VRDEIASLLLGVATIDGSPTSHDSFRNRFGDDLPISVEQTTPLTQKHRRNMKTITPRKMAIIMIGAAALLSLATPARCGVTDITFSAYDQDGENTPYYNTFGLTTDLTITQPDLAGIELDDSGYQDPYVTVQDDAQSTWDWINSSALRSVGWHQYEFSLNSTTDVYSIYMDGGLIQSATYSLNSSSPLYFYMMYHDYYQGTNVSLIENLSVTFNNQTVFQDNFESSTLNSAYTVDRLDSGTYINSGGGELQIGNVGSGNVAATLSIPVSVPEPSTWAMIIVGIGSLFLIAVRAPKRNPARVL
jgi:hypothetical protein